MLKKVVMLIVAILSVVFMISSSRVNANQLQQVSAVVIDPCDVDFNGSGKVDIQDIMEVALCWRSTDSGCDRYKLDGDDDIDIVDIMLVAAQWGQSCATSTPPPFGVDMVTTGINEDGGSSLAQEAGVIWVRVAMGWSLVEGEGALPPDTPTYNWGGYDAWFSNAANAGMTLIVIVGFPVPNNYCSAECDAPYCCLVSSDTLTPEYEDTGLSRFADFLMAAAERYDGDGIDDAPGSPVVKYWELGNEPDSANTSGGHYGLCYGNYGGEYAELLMTAWAALHSDPGREAYLVFGGMAYEDCCGFNIDFLDDVLGYIGGHPLPSGEQYFDIMNYHGYHYFVCNSSLGYDPPTIVGKANVVRSKLASHSLEKPLMLTEAGWWTNSGSECGVPNSLERQSRYVVQVFVRSMAADLVSTIWHNLKDFYVGAYGIVDSNLNPKPAYWAYKTMTDELAGYSYSRALTIGETGSSDIEGHVFANGGGEEKWVLWTTIAATDITQPMSLPFETIRVVQKEKYSDAFPAGDGNPAAVSIIEDDGPGDLDGADNGQIRINITASPVYVEPQ